MGVAQVGRALAADAVDVFVSVGIPQPRPFTTDDGEWTFRVDAGGMGGFEGDDVLSYGMVGISQRM